MKVYIYGGLFREKLININNEPNDLDFICVIDETDNIDEKENNDNIFNYMIKYLQNKKLIIRYKSYEMWTCKGYVKNSIISKFSLDFTLARNFIKDENGNKKITIGSLENELSKKDFTFNTFAKEYDIDNLTIIKDAPLIDLFNGQQHLNEKKFVSIIDPNIAFVEDSIKVLRLIRLSATLEFEIPQEYLDIIKDNDVVISKDITNKISDERLREELHKMFVKNTPRSLELFYKIYQIAPNIYNAFLNRKKFWLIPTVQNKV